MLHTNRTTRHPHSRTKHPTNNPTTLLTLPIRTHTTNYVEQYQTVQPTPKTQLYNGTNSQAGPRCTVPLSLVSWEIFLLAHSHATCCHSAGFFCCNAAWEAKLGFPFPTLSWGLLSLSLKSSRAPSPPSSWEASLVFPFYPLPDPTDSTPCHVECCLYLIVESPWKKRSSFHDDLASSNTIEDSPRGLEGGIKCDSRKRTGQGESLRSVEKISRVF